ncbi:beta/gamma crystallin domain-containing protein [Vibrio caribbeanicus]|uniref:beta/gamma crystallin domain-containing protein n=1 Tax=Vibrio caribbeanicus TaxID=701175 RepID=UPI0030D97F46
MFKYNKFIISTLGLICSGTVIADGFSFNNPDGMNIKVIDGNGYEIYYSPNVMDYFGWRPSTDYVTIKAVNNSGTEVFSKEFRTSQRNYPMCNYTLLVTEYNGYRHEKSSISGKDCTADEDNYFPDSGVPKYSIDNISNHKVYPAFAKNGDNYEPDTIHGFLHPGVIRTYTPEDAYWSSPAVNIGEDTETSVAVFDPYLGKYVVCKDFEPAHGTKTWFYSKINGEYECTLKALSKAPFNTGALFYEGFNYQGQVHKYDESVGVVNLPSVLNDKFKSVEIGQFSKVFAWTHYESKPTQAYELMENTPDLNFIGGLSKFKVTPKEVEGVYIRLVDGINTGTLYCMMPKVYGEGEGADVNSCTDNETYQLLGTLNPTEGGESIVTQIPVRNMDHSSPNFGQFISNGSLYFKIDSYGDVSVSHENGEFENFPDNLTIREVRDNTFDVEIVSEEPDLDF